MISPIVPEYPLWLICGENSKRKIFQNFWSCVAEFSGCLRKIDVNLTEAVVTSWFFPNWQIFSAEALNFCFCFQAFSCCHKLSTWEIYLSLVISRFKLNFTRFWYNFSFFLFSHNIFFNSLFFGWFFFLFNFWTFTKKSHFLLYIFFCNCDNLEIF